MKNLKKQLMNKIKFNKKIKIKFKIMKKKFKS